MGDLHSPVAWHWARGSAVGFRHTLTPLAPFVPHMDQFSLGLRQPMRCIACGAEMRLVGVSLTDTPMAGFERHTFKCSTCSHVSRRLVLRPRPPVIDLPVLNLPVVVQSPEPPATKLQKQVIAGSARAKLAEKLRSRQVAAQKRAARARTSPWAEAVEKLRRKQAALKEAAVASSPQPDKCERPPARPSGPPNETFSPQGPPHLNLPALTAFNDDKETQQG
jgi:hypothetical protein